MRKSQILALRKKTAAPLVRASDGDDLEQPSLPSATPTPAKPTSTPQQAQLRTSNQPSATDEDQDEPIAAPRPALAVRAFKPPAPLLLSATPSRPSIMSLATAPVPSAVKQANATDRYFRVLYTKRSNKKHKAYDDGFLVIVGKKCILKDLEEKVVTQQMVKLEPASLGCESRLEIGGYQAEIVEIIKADDYLSGRVFLANRPPASPVVSGPVATHFKKVVPSSTAPAANDFTPPATIGGGGGSSGISRPAPVKRSALLLASSCPCSSSSSSSVLPSPRAPIPSNRPSIRDLLQDGIVLNRQFLEGPKRQVPVVIDTCIGRYLRPHQIEGVQFMYNCLMGISSPGYAGCILADPMGLGKSLQAIALTWTLLNSGPKGSPEIEKAIFVCPATLVRNWEDEFKKWLGSHLCKPVVLDASSKFPEQEAKVKQFIFAPPRNKQEAVLIVGYEMIQKHLALLHKLQGPLIICDEGHRLKNHSGNKTIKGLSSIVTSRRLLLTGTPVQNNLMEFFAMVDFVNPGFLGSARSFQNTFATPIAHSRDNLSTGKEQTLGEMRSKELARLTAKLVLRRSGNILKKYLPPKIEMILFCPLGELQAKVYSAMLRSKAVHGAVANDNSAAALTCLIALKKVCNHPALIVPECRKCLYQPPPPLPHSLVLGSIGDKERQQQADLEGQKAAQQAQLLFGEAAKTLPADLSPEELNLELSTKLVVLAHILQFVRSNKEKVVVVSGSGKTLNVIQKLCSQRGYEYLRLDGGVKGQVRMDLVHQFNGNALKWVFLLSAKAGGMGLNLVGANRLVLFEPDWNPAIDAQAMGRVWRDGQTRQVYVYRLLATATIDEKIFQRQIRKQEVAEAVTEDRTDGGRNFSHKNLKELFTYRNNTLCETFDLLTANQEKLNLKQKWDFLNPREVEDPLIATLPAETVSFVFRWDSRNQKEEELPDSLDILSATLLGKDRQADEEGKAEEGESPPLKKRKKRAQPAEEDDVLEEETPHEEEKDEETLPHEEQQEPDEEREQPPAEPTPPKRRKKHIVEEEEEEDNPHVQAEPEIGQAAQEANTREDTGDADELDLELA